ncbi:MAG: hypothetical protein RIB78_10895 [Gammaproteobacteria bacterium]
MQADKYIKYYLVNDIILAIVLAVTGYAWYLLISGQANPDEVARGDAIADVVIPAKPDARVNES